MVRIQSNPSCRSWNTFINDVIKKQAIKHRDRIVDHDTIYTRTRRPTPGEQKTPTPLARRSNLGDVWWPISGMVITTSYYEVRTFTYYSGAVRVKCKYANKILRCSVQVSICLMIPLARTVLLWWTQKCVITYLSCSLRWSYFWAEVPSASRLLPTLQRNVGLDRELRPENGGRWPSETSTT
jgi:hypothetical protein